MLSRLSALPLALLALTAPATSAQVLYPLSAEQIAQAAKDTQHKGYYDSDGTVFTTPYARVVWAAKQAAKELKVFTPPAPDADVVGPYIEIECEPFPVNRRYSPPRVVSPQRVVLIPKGSKDVSLAIQPSAEERIPREFKNAIGGVWTGHALRARFPITALTEQMEVIRINDDSDHQYRSKVKLKNVK